MVAAPSIFNIVGGVAATAMRRARSSVTPTISLAMRHQLTHHGDEPCAAVDVAHPHAPRHERQRHETRSAMAVADETVHTDTACCPPIFQSAMKSATSPGSLDVCITPPAGVMIVSARIVGPRWV